MEYAGREAKEDDDVFMAGGARAVAQLTRCARRLQRYSVYHRLRRVRLRLGYHPNCGFRQVCLCQGGADDQGRHEMGADGRGYHRQKRVSESYLLRDREGVG